MAVQPLISVITVTYNAADVIEKTLDSLRIQSFQDFEHIVIDGASKDNTVGLVRNFKLPNTIIISEKDKGLYDAMNKGLVMAKGKYVVFLNAGDRFHSADSLMLYASEASKNADIIYGDTEIVDSDGNFISKRHLSAPPHLTKKSFSQGMLVCHQAFMVRKELAPPYDLKYKFSADYDWCVKTIEKSDPSKLINLNRVTIDYLSDGLTDKNKLKSLKERFLIMQSHYGFFPTLRNHFGFLVRALKRGRL